MIASTAVVSVVVGSLFIAARIVCVGVLCLVLVLLFCYCKTFDICGIKIWRF